MRAIFDETLQLIEKLGAELVDITLPHSAYGISGLLRHRAGRGERQPRALRRRPLRPPRGQRRPAVAVRADPPRRLRRRGQAAHHARHLRAVERLLRRLLRHRAEGPHEDRRGLPERVREGRPDRHADRADRRVQARREDQRPARDVPERRADRADVAGRRARRSRSRAACPTGCRSASSSPARGSSENKVLDAAHALEKAIGFDEAPWKTK